MHLRLIVSLASFGSVVDEVGNKEKSKGQSLSDFDVEPLARYEKPSHNKRIGEQVSPPLSQRREQPATSLESRQRR